MSAILVTSSATSASSSISSALESASTSTNSDGTIPSQTRTRSGPPSGTPSDFGGGGEGGGNQFGSPAASNLYLYTFLATLVLLLLVSGAVVARSISLRVRARRAIEESIRNGTYVPPAIHLVGANAPKPAFHDVHIKDSGMTAFLDEKHTRTRWEYLVPVAASFVPSRSPRPLPQPATLAHPRTRTLITTRFRNLNPFRTVRLQDILDELTSRDLHSRMAVQQSPAPTQAELATAAFRTSVPPSNEDANADQQVIERPSAVRIAVLIAMPDPARPTSISARVDDATSSGPSAKGKTPASSSGTDITKECDVVDMPYVELGITEVAFASAEPQTDPSRGSPVSPPPNTTN